MKKRYIWTLAGGMLGAAGALISSASGADFMERMLRPFTILGGCLRGWSLSGAAGNAAAWAALIVLSLLPVIFILIARRKRKQGGDWLFLLTGAVIFGGLFLLINPTMYVHPAMTEALKHSPELLTGGPVYAMGSMLFLSVIVRWSGGLMTRKRQDGRLIFWMKALLTGAMALTAFSSAWSLADGWKALGAGGGASTDPWAMMEGSLAPEIMGVSRGDQDMSALILFGLSVIGLIPSLFSVMALDAAVSLAASMGGGWFSEETGVCASVLAVRARYALIASVACMAAANLITVLLGRWILNWDIRFSLQTGDLLLSCGALLLARLISAACKVKRDNELMI